MVDITIQTPMGPAQVLGALGTGDRQERKIALGGEGASPEPMAQHGPGAGTPLVAKYEPSTVKVRDIASLKHRAHDAYAFFKSKNYSDIAATALVGRLLQEHQLQGGGFTGDNGTAFGVGQWRLGRAQDMLNFASSSKANPEALQTQFEFLDYEMRGHTKNLTRHQREGGKRLMAATSLDEALSGAYDYWSPGASRSDEIKWMKTRLREVGML